MSRSSHPVAGIILAAGESTRFGEANKLLAEIDGTPVVRRATETMVDSMADPIVVVVGHESERVGHCLGDLPIDLVENPEFANGQSTSVRAGIEAVPQEAVAVVIGLGDMPLVRPGTVDTLIEAYRAERGTALSAAYKGTRGNPVLFDRDHFETLRDLSGDIGGREILREQGVLIETGDRAVCRDIDTPDDLSHFRNDPC